MEGIHIKGGYDKFNLESLREMASQVKDNDVVRGKAHLEKVGEFKLFKKRDTEMVYTLYQKTKDQGSHKVEQRSIKREMAWENLQQGLNNVVGQLAGGSEAKKEFLQQAFRSILNQAKKPGDMLGKDLKKVVEFVDVANNMWDSRRMDCSHADEELGRLGDGDLTKLLANKMDVTVNASPQARMRMVTLGQVTLEEVRQGWLHNEPSPKSPEALIKSFKLLTSVYICANAQDMSKGGDLKVKPDFTLCKALVRLELTETHNEGKLVADNIMRGNTLATKYLTGCARGVGSEWLKDVIGGTMSNVCLSSENGSLKVKKGETDETDGSKKIASLYSEMMKSLCSSGDKVPQELCDLAKFVYQEVVGKCGEKAARDAAIGVLLLRLVSPALATPFNSPFTLDNFKIDLKNTSKDSQEALKLLSIMLQNQSNRKSLDAYPCLQSVLLKHEGELDVLLNKVLNRGNDMKVMPLGKDMEGGSVNILEDFDPQKEFDLRNKKEDQLIEELGDLSGGNNRSTGNHIDINSRIDQNNFTPLSFNPPLKFNNKDEKEGN